MIVQARTAQYWDLLAWNLGSKEDAMVPLFGILTKQL